MNESENYKWPNKMASEWMRISSHVEEEVAPGKSQGSVYFQ